MKKKALLLSLFLGVCTTMGWAQDEDAYKGWMKALPGTVGGIRKNLEAKSLEAVVGDAKKLEEIFGHSAEFWTKRGGADAAGWSTPALRARTRFEIFLWFKGPPFDQEEDFKARSPITYIKNVKTPMMFILGETDSRTPPSAGGEQMFRALKFRKIPTVMVKFPNETHELSRAGQPWHRIERLQHIVGWFDKWLMGVAKPEYDVAPNDVPVKPNAAPKTKPPGN